MITMPNNEQNIEAAVDNQETEQVASIKLDDVTGGWGWYGPGPGYGYAAWGGPGPYAAPYNPYAAAAMDRRAAWYAAHTPPSPRYAGWWY